VAVTSEAVVNVCIKISEMSQHFICFNGSVSAKHAPLQKREKEGGAAFYKLHVLVK
jgi:hypothetical protein